MAFYNIDDYNQFKQNDRNNGDKLKKVECDFYKISKDNCTTEIVAAMMRSSAAPQAR